MSILFHISFVGEIMNAHHNKFVQLLKCIFHDNQTVVTSDDVNFHYNTTGGIGVHFVSGLYYTVLT